MNIIHKSESAESLIASFVGHTSDNEVHEVILENSQGCDLRSMEALKYNPSIAKKIWWELFNAEIAQSQANKSTPYYGLLRHNLDQEQLLAVLSIDGYGYRHAAFMTSGLPVVDEKTSKIIMESGWLDNQMKVDWLKTGTAPKALVDEYRTVFGQLPEVMPRDVTTGKKRGYWYQLDPRDYELTYQGRLDAANAPGGQSIVHNPEVHAYIEKMLSGSGKQTWRLLIALAQNWEGSIKDLVESCKVLLDA